MSGTDGSFDYDAGKTQNNSEFGSNSDVSNRMDKPDGIRSSVDYVHKGAGSQDGYDENSGNFADDAAAQVSLSEQSSWQSSGYISMGDDALRQNGETPHDIQDHRLVALHGQDDMIQQMGKKEYHPIKLNDGDHPDYMTQLEHGYAQTQGYDLSSGIVGGYPNDPGARANVMQKMMDVGQQDVLQGHGMQMGMDLGVIPDPPRRILSKGRKNKDEANELVRRAKLLPKVMGVRYDANHQYWVATWYQNRKRMDRYFSVGRFGFEEARLLAIDCRKTAGKSLQGKSYDRPSYSKDGHSKSRSSYDIDQGMDKHSDYYASNDDMSKKSKDFNRLNVSKVALNYILSDLCNNCLPTILENNHMPGELYIHCYNKISDHLQMIITANQSEEIEKYLHLFQLCIQNRVLPSALQVQEQRAMITTLCQM